MDHYYEMRNMITTPSNVYQRVDTGHNADDKELKQILHDERGGPAASRPKELDQWFLQVYEYYSQKGLACILTCQVLDIFTIGSTWLFSAFVMLCIDWVALGRCSECMSDNTDGECKESCRSIVTAPSGGAFYRAVVSAYLMVLMAYLIYRAIVLAKDYNSWKSMQRFFKEDLGITDSELQTIEWAVVTQRLISLQQRFPSTFIKEFHDEHDITSRILRKDNYMIALVEGPLQGAMHLDHPWLNLLMGPKCLTHTLEWNLRICLLDRMFDEDYRVDSNFLQSEHSLRQTFYIAGVVNLILSPFIVMFVLVYFALKNAQRYHADPRTLSTRSWCLYAKYIFRKYNELPHCFQRRLNKAVPWAEKYVQQFASPLLSVYARFAAFLFSSLLAILIALWVINEQMMKLDFTFMGMHRNLYWYMGMFAMGLGMVRSFIIQHSNTAEAHEPLLSCISYTNYFPRHWRELRLTSIEVHNEFTDLFMLNVAIPGLHRSIFVQEMLGVIITPFILWFVLPDKAGEILTFLRTYTVEKKAVNGICSFADFSNDGFCRHGAMNADDASEDIRRTEAEPDIEQGPSGHESARSDRHLRWSNSVQQMDNKFHKSFVGFKANNPLWEPPEEGQQLLCRLMETIELRSDYDGENRRFAMPRAGNGALAASGVSGRHSVSQRDPVSAANAAAAFISGSHYLPPEDAESVQNAIFQRFKNHSNLIGLSHLPSGGTIVNDGCERGLRIGALGLSSGVRWGGNRDGMEAPFEASVSGRRLEIDEHLLNVLLMEYSETYANGVPVGCGFVHEGGASAGAGIDILPAFPNADGKQCLGPLETQHENPAHGAAGGNGDVERGEAPCAPFAG